ncbi:hypothetical protein [Pollutibacter soli]|uniref:hypothetical protein n=1 Tax=Pollutibacter soli TaxID=3034157 RepID=UPI003013635D
MNLILLISLSVASLLAVVDFLSGNKKMWIRFSCCILSIVSLTAVYLIYKEDAGRLIKSRSEASNSKQLLEKAGTVMSENSDILSGELEKMHQAIISYKKSDTTVKHSLLRLEHHVRVLQNSSRQLQAEMKEVYSDKSADSLFLLLPEPSGDDARNSNVQEVYSEGNN